MSPSFLIHTKNYILLGCRRVCCCVCSRSHGIHSTLCTVVHAKKNMALIICRYLLPFETREWKEEGTRKRLACQWLYIREKNSWIYTREGGWQQTRRTTPTFSWASCCLPANTWPIPIFSPSLLVFFFSHRNTMEKCQPHPSAGVQCTFHRCSGLIVLQFTIDTRIRYQHKVSKYEAEKDQTGHYSHIFVFFKFHVRIVF